jgi:hypothetical protein
VDVDGDEPLVAGVLVELVDDDVEQPLVTASATTAIPIRVPLRLRSLIDFIVPPTGGRRPPLTFMP